MKMEKENKVIRLFLICIKGCNSKVMDIKVETKLNDTHTKEVYMAYSKGGKLLYVGQGVIGRNRHCLFGTSHNKGLNRYYFLNGEDGSIKTKIFSYFSCDDLAVEVELHLIKTLKPMCNSNHLPVEEKRKTTASFKWCAEEYYNKQTELDTTVYPKEKERLEKEMRHLKTLNKDFKKIVDTLGIKEIRKTGNHITKSRAIYNIQVGINPIAKKKLSACKKLKLKQGDFITYSELKERIQQSYNKANLDVIAKATDIKELFNVKRTTRGGVEGFLIGDKL